MDVEKIVREYIDKTIHMSLATSKGNQPWVCEVHFAYDDDLNLYFRSLKSRRHSQENAANPNVAGNIVRQHVADEVPNGIYFEGTAQLVTEEAERSRVFPLLRDRLGVDESILDEAKRDDGHQFYKVTVETWYTFGKFDGEVVQKSELNWNGGAK